jgi:glycosyltransferase involved in cell wall biosynthesis
MSAMAEPLRILHTEASCGWGGQELRILSEASGLIARGHEVAIACPAHAPIALAALEQGIEVIALPIEKKRLPGLFAMRALLRRRRFDVINTHSSTDTWLVALSCATLSDAPPLVRTRHISTPIPRTRANRWLYGRATARIVTTGEAMRRLLIDEYGFDGARIESVPTGIDTALYSPGDRAQARGALGLRADGQVIGIVATLRKAKGHHLLLESLAAMGAQAPDLLIVGDGPQRPMLEAQVDRLGLRARVRFAGNQTDVVPWLRALDVFVLPTLHEGVPQALTQAMSVGLCCVTTPVGGIPELADDGESAVFVAPDDVDALTGALRRVLADDALRARLGRNARARRLAGFDRNAMLDRMEALFRSLARRHAAAVR